MKTATRYLCAGLLTFTLGVTITSLWLFFRENLQPDAVVIPAQTVQPLPLRSTSKTSAQNKLQLEDWSGKYPINEEKSFRNFFRVRTLRHRLQKLVGHDYYRRVTFNDNFTIVPIKVVSNYLIVRTCESHNCVSKQSFLAIDLGAGDIHLALYHYGSLEWFHTKGIASELPSEVREEFDLSMPSDPREVHEITRSAI